MSATVNVFETQLNGLKSNPVLVRKIKLIALALLMILVSLAVFAVIGLLPQTLPTLSEINSNYSPYVRLTNAMIALVCAAFLLWPREGSRLVGRWSDYVGAAFLSFCVQYGVRFVALLLSHRFPAYKERIEFARDVIVYLCSYFNNLLMLAAARILLNKNRKIRESQRPARDAGFLQRLKYEWRMLRAALPNWVWFTAPVILIALLERYEDLYSYFLWVRFPDALFSVYCLGWFGYAVWLSFFVRSRKKLAQLGYMGSASNWLKPIVNKTLAWLGFFLVIAYASGQLIYAANPLIASYMEPTLNSPLSRWVQSHVESKVFADIQQAAKELHAENELAAAKTNLKPTPEQIKNAQPTPQELFKSASEFFDGAIFAILFPMKSLLFLPPFILYLAIIISVNDFREALHATTNTRRDYLSRDGILKVFGFSVEADEVRLIIRLPGVKRRQDTEEEERVWEEVWSAPDAPPAKKRPRIYPIASDPLLVLAMQKEGKEKILTSKNDSKDYPELWKDTHVPQTLVLIPIKFHGGIIGVLRVVFRGYGRYSDDALEQLKFMAELVAPSVQDWRTMAAIDKLGPRLSRALADSLTQADKSTNGFQLVIDKIAETLYDLLNPLGVRLFLECGFEDVKADFPREVGDYRLLKSDEDGQGETRKETEDGKEKKASPSVLKEEGPIQIEPDELYVRTERGAPYNLGRMELAIPGDKDNFARPTLAAYYLTRRMLASLTAHGILTAAHNSLSLVIQDLNVELNKENLSVAEWFEMLQAAGKRAGFAWVVAEEGEGKPLLGRPEHVEIVSGLTDEEKEKLMRDPRHCLPHCAPEVAAHNLIHLIQLGEPGHKLWFGVKRAGFGGELSFRSPWEVFLKSLANVAGTALLRIEERERDEARRSEEEAQRRKEAEDEWLTAFADLTNMVMHQLVNMVKNLLGIAEDALESVSDSPVESNDQLLVSTRDMKKSAELMLEFTGAYNKLIEVDGGDSCSIAVAAQRAKKLFQFGLRKKSIEIKIDVPPSVVAKVPANVAALVLANLIGNAIEAIRARGTIKIEARTNGSSVLCHVKNDGPPIPEADWLGLFQRGPKHKEGHSGWGLYLISRFLDNYEGKVNLSHSHSKETCFTLNLPK